MASVTGPWRTPASSHASMRTSPDSPVRLMMRAKPWYPPCNQRAADGKNATACVTLAPSPAVSVCAGAVDRLVRCPERVESRLITSTGASALTTSCHLPCPVPSDPLRPSPSPDSNCCALSIREAPAASESSTVPSDDAPVASMPSMRTSAPCVPALTTRSQLTRLRLRPGLKMTTR
jgi:hypothetical protein